MTCTRSTWLLALVARALLGQAPSSPAPRLITKSSPLGAAAQLLQGEYAKVITYEDPVWIWLGELQVMGRAKPTDKWGLMPMPRSVSLPAFSNGSQNLSDLLNGAVTNFNSQAPAPQFKVTTWDLGFHIIPIRIRDQTGAVVTASNPLDVIVSVPEGQRSATEQFKELCSAVSATTGMSLTLNMPGIRPWLDQAFEGDSGPFVWSVNGSVARDALVDLVLRSATTLSWELLCQPSAAPQNRFCSLNIRPLTVDVPDGAGKYIATVLTYDRCGKCPHRIPPPVPPPPPPPPPEQ